MLTIGDVFGIVALLAGLFLTSWAMTVASALLFPGPVERSQAALAGASRKTLGLGLGLTLVPGFVGFVLLASPSPAAKLLGWVVVLALLALASLGLAGTARIVSTRIQELDPSLAPYPAFVRAAGYLIGGAMLPVLGWFAFGPFLLAASVGAGYKGLFRRPPSPEIANAPEPA
ncbi:MAG TPA: hypothetical protein VGE01_02355 [Fimbriimonas sp.]